MLAAHLLDLFAPQGIGDEIVPGARLVGVSDEISPRATFEVRGEQIQVELSPLAPGARFAARSRLLAFSYRAGAGGAVVDAALGLALCRALAARVAPAEQAFMQAMERDAALRIAEVGDARVREVRVDRVLEHAVAGGGVCLSVSPYVGCLIGCRFCYAQSKLAVVRRLSMLPEVPWGSYVDVRVNAAEVLARELEDAPPLPVKFCPIVSDPYHAVERRYRLTRACLSAIRDARTPRPTLVLTRATLVTRDIDVLAAMPRAYVGFSLPTIDDDVRRHFEPRGATIDDRLAALAALRDAGVRTFAVVQPLLPGPIDAFADALAAHVGSARIDVLHGLEGASADFDDPRFLEAAGAGWQEDRAAALREALRARGVALWPDELPPDLELRTSPDTRAPAAP